MRVDVDHTIGFLARDMRTIATTARPKFSKTIRRNTAQGSAAARRIARGASGIHGKNYFKRITHELIDPLTGEYGPHGDVVGNAVGAGWRHGPPNTDLEKSLDIQGPKFRKDINSDLDGLFWP